MGRIPDEVIDQVREHFDILDVVGQYVQLKRSGRNYFGLCPFHSEKTPSFSVAPDKQIFYCFGCGAGGDVIKFMMEIEQLTFVEAVRHLADQAGIALPEADREDRPEEDRRTRLRQALELAARLYHHLLVNTDHGQSARAYLERRGVSMETIREFQIGYAPASRQFLLSFLKRRGFQEQEMEEAGLITMRENGTGYYDRFRGRVMFPIHDAQGRVIGFGGRLLGEGRPKYLNSPETPVFHKGRNLFNLHRARQAMRKDQQAVLFEGYMDVIAAWQAGIRSGVASLGTSLTEEQARVIRRNAEMAIICYDADDAGQSAADRGLELLHEQGVIVKVARLPQGMDPDDYIRERSAESFRRDVIYSALPLTAFKLERLKKDYDLRDEPQRLKYLTQALEVIADLSLAIEQDHYVRRLAEEHQLSLDALKQELRRIRRRKQRENKGDKGQTKWNNEYHNTKHMVGPDRRTAAHEAEKQLLAMMIRDKEIAAYVQEAIGADFHVDEYQAIVARLYAYYAEGYPADPGRFLHYVKDAELSSYISELAMMDIPDDFPGKAVDDCIRRIRHHTIHLQLIEIKRQIEEAERAGDTAKAAQLGIELLQLEKKKKMLA
jgi:DNA primase